MNSTHVGFSNDLKWLEKIISLSCNS